VKKSIDMSEREAFSIPEVAKIMGTSTATIWRWVNTGLIPVIKIVGRVFISRKDLDTVLSSACKRTKK